MMEHYTPKAYIILFILLLTLPLYTWAADLKNGERINATCAFCHGMFGQGT